MYQILADLLDEEYSEVLDVLIEDCGFGIELLEECGSAFMMKRVFQGLEGRRPLDQAERSALSRYSSLVSRAYKSAPHIDKSLLEALFIVATGIAYVVRRLHDESRDVTGAVNLIRTSSYVRGCFTEYINSRTGGDHDMARAYTDLVITNLNLGVTLAEERSKLDEVAAGRLNGALKRHENDPKQQDKALVQEFWNAWRAEPNRYSGKSAFARDMLDKFPRLKSQEVIARWCRAWENEATTLLA